ncbi:ATP-binding protein [Streptomyces sp. SCSIO 30461]|uniref:ATP-binding protein n=1 Tax=Streptomyces sp. SCSIO 30461 TaxID=3118085 RepID=UPI0030CFF46B
MAFEITGHDAISAAPCRGMLQRVRRLRRESRGRKRALGRVFRRQPVRSSGTSRNGTADREASWSLSRDLASPHRARTLVAAQFDEWALRDVDSTAELLVSELVTNAVRHTRGPLRLNLLVHDGRLRCEVEDTSSVSPMCAPADDEAEGGRGMVILDVLADVWGSCRTPTGKTTWFEVPTVRS